MDVANAAYICLEVRLRSMLPAVIISSSSRCVTNRGPLRKNAELLRAKTLDQLIESTALCIVVQADRCQSSDCHGHLPPTTSPEGAFLRMKNSVSHTSIGGRIINVVAALKNIVSFALQDVGCAEFQF
jgi:hypothetical protein